MPAESSARLAQVQAMTRSALIAFGCGALVATLFCIFLFGNRYELVRKPGDEEAMYKIDRRTGRMWLVGENQTEDVNGVIPPSKSSPLSPEDEAIALVRSDLFILPSAVSPSTTENSIRDALGHKKGTLRIHGWRARKIDDQTYLVGYVYDEGPNSQVNGWLFEVNRTANIVRNVVGDPDLEKKYADWSAQLDLK
jgi:hypothetical protein